MNWIRLAPETIAHTADLVFLEGESPIDSWFDPDIKQGSGPYEHEPQYCNQNGYGNGHWTVASILSSDGNSKCSVWRDLSGEYPAMHAGGQAFGSLNKSKPRIVKPKMSPFFSIPSPHP